MVVFYIYCVYSFSCLLPFNLVNKVDYKCLCAAITIYATLIGQKLDFYILTRDLKK